MNRLAKIVIVLLLAICLPTEGVAAAAMSLCNMPAHNRSVAGEQTTSEQTSSEHAQSDGMEHCKHAAMQHSHDQNKQQPEKNNCAKASCSLCAAQAFLSHIVPLVAAATPDSLSPRFEINKPQSIITPFFRPPISA